MKYSNFEEVPVWKDGLELTTPAFRLTKDKEFRFRGDVASQLQRAALSVPNNIAEGFERGTTPELVQCLSYAKGAAGEVRSICHVMDRLPYFGRLKSQISDLKSRAQSISRQLAGWAASLNETEIKGQRYLTESSRDGYQKQKRADAFTEKIKQDVEAARLARESQRQGQSS